MNFLELCREVRREMGYSGNGPSSVQGQVGEMERIVARVNRSYLEILQSRNDWAFMRKSLSTSTVVGEKTVTVADLKEVDSDSFELIDDGVRYSLIATTRDSVRYMGPMSNRPTHFYPERGKIVLWPTPNAVYTIEGDYYRVPQAMALNNGSVPIIPEEYHDAIVWLTVRDLGAFEESGNTYAHAGQKYAEVFFRMLQTETPGIMFGGPMA